ncbi:hypothetical protein ACHAQH_005818 [Verticillium albo-atrum]
MEHDDILTLFNFSWHLHMETCPPPPARFFSEFEFSTPPKLLTDAGVKETPKREGLKAVISHGVVSTDGQRYSAVPVPAPEITDGPYYIVGEYLRSNTIESEWCEGVPVLLEVQYVDVATCNPMPTVAVDIWNCNATGIYSGISTSGNYAADGLNSTHLRGVQLTDHNGVVQLETIFPGHYEGRATHTHLLSHANATVMPRHNRLSRVTWRQTLPKMYRLAKMRN